jgi:hypothetical protein
MLNMDCWMWTYWECANRWSQCLMLKAARWLWPRLLSRPHSDPPEEYTPHDPMSSGCGSLGYALGCVGPALSAPMLCIRVVRGNPAHLMLYLVGVALYIHYILYNTYYRPLVVWFMAAWCWLSANLYTPIYILLFCVLSSGNKSGANRPRRGLYYGLQYIGCRQ